MKIKNLLFGYYQTQCLYTVAKFKIADYLQDGPKSILELANAAGLLADKLYRVMRFLSANGLFDELPNKNFKSNEQTKFLISSSPDSLCHFICLHGEYFYKGASEFVNSINQEKSAFELNYKKSAAEYFKEDQQAGLIYHQAMKENTELTVTAISEIYNFSVFNTIVDIGGGTGYLLIKILLKNNAVSGINFDVPSLKNSSEELIKKYKLESRCHFIGGDFFKSIPGGDLYMMKAVLHGKTDEDVILLLNRCNTVLPKKGKILVIERVIDKNNENYLEVCLNDINLLTVTHGYVRNLAEFEALFKQANYAIQNIYNLPDGFSLMEIQSNIN